MVSVIVPNYNHSRFLKKRLDSILNQSYHDYEIILLDDCSEDDSIEVLSEYANHDKVVHFIKNTKNSGSPFKQWKKGLDVAKGEYIWIAESDDFAHPDFLKRTIDLLSINEQLGLVVTSSLLVDDENKSLNQDTKTLLSIKSKGKINGHEKIIVCSYKDFITRYFWGESSIYNASSVLFRRSFIPEVNNGYEFKEQVGDVFFWAGILLNKGDVAFLNENLNYFRIHKTSATSTNNRQKKETIILEEYEFLNYLYSVSNFEINKNVKNVGLNRMALKLVRYFWDNGKLFAFKKGLPFLRKVCKYDKMVYLRVYGLYFDFVLKKIIKKLLG